MVRCDIFSLYSTHTNTFTKISTKEGETSARPSVTHLEGLGVGDGGGDRPGGSLQWAMQLVIPQHPNTPGYPKMSHAPQKGSLKTVKNPKHKNVPCGST